MTWTAAIIAGGSASRLGGRDKSSLLVGDCSILDRQLGIIRPLTERVFVVANRPERFRATGLPVLQDEIPGAGALGGVYTALRAATTEKVVAIACDMPFINGPFLEHLASAGSDADLAIPKPADGYQPLCACYSRACIGAIGSRITRHALRVQALVDEVRSVVIGPEELAPFDPHGLLFFNVNTADDLRRAQELAAMQESGQQP